ncbi:MAG: RNA polymerase sporulation sigma factor SigE [Clostridia bacterium]|nr:RNA polymerase sporulation sigma factor SigE [Clostridia bacterium]MBR3819907.1 RNA polymerase sporulation sigma factor SigE [Clostridia bacterium]
MNIKSTKFIASLRKFIDKIKCKLFEVEVDYINGPESLPAPLSVEEENILLLKHENGDKDAREELIVHNLRLVVYIAKKFENTGIAIEDLISIGTLGLIKAVNTFRISKNIKLATYASRCIENEILMYLRKTNSLKAEVSYFEPLNVDWDGNELLLSDVLGNEPEDVYRELEEDDEKSRLYKIISSLEEREKMIMTMRFGIGGGKEYTQKEVADSLGISQSYISRLEKRIIEKIKREI